MIFLGFCVFFGLFIIALGIFYAGNVLKEGIEALDLNFIHMIALDRIRIKIDLAEMGFEIPDWLTENFEEEDEDGEAEEVLKKGKLLRLVRKDKNESKPENKDEEENKKEKDDELTES